MSGLKLLLLGPFHFERNGISLEVDTRKSIALLAYLAATGESHSREELATLFWPDYDQSRARAYLRRTLWTLNKALTRAWLDVNREQIGLKYRDDLWVDVDQFHRLLAAYQAHNHPANDMCSDCFALLTEAVALYRDDFLKGFTLPDSPAFDEWQFFHTESLRRELADALKQLVRGYTHQGAFELAISYARRWLLLDPLQEPVHRYLMRLYSWAGQQSTALRQYQECVQLLGDELGISPDETTQELYEAIKARRLPPPPYIEGQVDKTTQDHQGGKIPLISSEAPSSTHLSNLPAQPTPFIGRKEELQKMNQLLQAEPACRLLTLVGPGGIGKTRLALEAATKASETFGHRVYFVSLASVNSVELLVSAIATALKIPLSGQEHPKMQLLNYLREKQILLVLDNFEHLLDGANILSDIMVHTPRAKLLVTSRERLNLRGEWIMKIGGLDFPANSGYSEDQVRVESPPDSSEISHSLMDYSAIQLFLAGAGRAQIDFSLSGQEQAIVHICQLVDGMPLALELASAWVKMLSCEEIAQEIEQNLDFLSTSLRDVPTRHRSLRAVFEHSWQLLTEAEKVTFRRLSVFQGGFDKEAAEKVADASLLLLAALIDKSLIHRNASGTYRMHELLRQYGTEKLEQMAGESEMVRNRHSDHYLAFLQQQETYLKDGGQKDALARIALGSDNIRASWHWAMTQGQPLATAISTKKALAAIKQAANSLMIFYAIRNEQEGMSMFALAVSALDHLADLVGVLAAEKRKGLGIVLARQGYFCYRLGFHQKATQLLQKSLSIASDLEVRSEIAFSLNSLGNIARETGAFAQARQSHQQGISICNEIEDVWLKGVILSDLGNTLRKLGDYKEAKQSLQKSYMIFKELDNLWGMARSGSRLSYVTYLLGEHIEAKETYQESLTFYEEIGDAAGMGTCILGLGNVAYALKIYNEAQQQYQESLAMFKEISAAHEMTFALNGLGNVACVLGDYAASRDYFHQALKITIDLNKTPMTLDILVGLATLLIASGEEQGQAVELLVLAQTHPASEQQTQEKAAQVLTDLAPALTPDGMITTQQRGKARKLDKVLVEILH